MVIAYLNTTQVIDFFSYMYMPLRLFRRHSGDGPVQSLYTRVNSIGNLFQRICTCAV